MRRFALALAAVCALLVPADPALAGSLPPVRHVFVIVLENENAQTTFGAGSKAPYLARTLARRGAFVPGYYGVTHVSLGNYVAMISGQGSNSQTQTDCQVFAPFASAGSGPNGQALGQGCVYPSSVPTLAGQLTARRLSWRGYMEDMGNDPSREAKTCAHPAIGTPDRTQRAQRGDQYATRHNPFVYFRGIIDRPACRRQVVELAQLRRDLRSAATTPNFSFITPNLCHDGHDSPCVDGEPGGLVSADRFLRAWVPRILGSRAYRRDGMLVITFDEAEAIGAGGDASACCGQPQFPNTANNGGFIAGRGGGRVGAVVLSRWTRPATRTAHAYNHFSLLRTIEDLFGLRRLGYAARPGLRAFGRDVFSARG